MQTASYAERFAQTLRAGGVTIAEMVVIGTRGVMKTRCQGSADRAALLMRRAGMEAKIADAALEVADDRLLAGRRYDRVLGVYFKVIPQ